MKEEDKERIDAKANIYSALFPSEIDYKFIRYVFKDGAEYEHPIAFNQGKIEGFNEGIEAALKVLRENDTVPKSWFFEEIEKLKNPI